MTTVPLIKSPSNAYPGTKVESITDTTPDTPIETTLPPTYSSLYPAVVVEPVVYPILRAPFPIPSAPPLDQLMEYAPYLQNASSPLDFRTSSHSKFTYVITLPQNNGHRMISNQTQLDTLNALIKKCTPNPEFPIMGFHPVIIDNHPIHQQLKTLCTQFLASRQNMPIDTRLRQCEAGVAEILSSMGSPEFLPVIARLPKFELIEIAVRNHLFMGLLAQHKDQIAQFFRLHNCFPEDLGNVESALIAFVTKNHFYIPPQMDLVPFLCDRQHLDTLIRACVDQGREGPLGVAIAHNEQLINRHLTELRLAVPSLVSSCFEYWVRELLTRKMITKQAEHWDRQFGENGTITFEEMNAATQELSGFNTANGKFSPGLRNEGNVRSAVSPMVQLMIETFHLPLVSTCTLREQTPFASVKETLVKRQEEQLLNAQKTPLPQPRKGLFSLFSRAPVVTLESQIQKIQDRAAKQQETLLWAEREWNALFQPSAPSLSSLPLTSDAQDSFANELETLLDGEPAANEIPLTPSPQAIITPPLVDPLPSAPSLSSLLPPRRITANDHDIPLVSWINLAFGHVMNRSTALENWQALPEIARHDALRHAIHYPTCQGKAEDIARELFKTVDGLQKELPQKPHYPLIQTGVSPEFVQIGESLLRAYYPRTIPSSFDREFPTLPGENRFYLYVYELAKAAGVHIEDWDREFGAWNWNKMGMVHISMQAIERCLHTDATP